jgi:glycerol-3-phosphate dehydrogenase (NAD(P)+)
MAKILILGAGVMGTAITIPMTYNGHAVHLVGTHLDGDIIEEIQESRFHPRLRNRVADTVTPYTYDRLGEALDGVDLVVLGVNSQGIDWAAEMLGPRLSSHTPIVLLTKGLAGDGQTLYILPDALREGLPSKYRNLVQLAAIGGPSIAGELAALRHTCVVLTGSNQALLEEIAALLRTPYYHIWTSTDVIGVEVCVALKNLYAEPRCTTRHPLSTPRPCGRSPTWSSIWGASGVASTVCRGLATFMPPVRTGATVAWDVCWG